jgi:glucan-binding YG repeat protein
MSKVNLPNALKGRIQSSIYDIIADGKISNTEVAEDFIGSCTNELDSVAIDLGIPTPSTLYQAIMPNGSGVISHDFIKFFQKSSKKEEETAVEQQNNIAQDLTALKFRLVTDDNESWSSELPSRRTEKGFDIVEAIQNSNLTKDFEISIVKNEAQGVEDIYDFKAKMLEDIRDKKIPFDIYVNDPYARKQFVWKHCFFTSVNWKPEGTNCLNASVSITKIPEYEVRAEQVEAPKQTNSRKQNKASSSKNKSNKTQQNKKGGTVKINAGTPQAQKNLQGIKDQIAKDRADQKKNPKKEGFYIDTNGRLKTNKIQNELSASGLNGTLGDRGIK